MDDINAAVRKALAEVSSGRFLLPIMATTKQLQSAELWSVLGGTAAFWSTLAASTLTQQRLLGIHTGAVPTLMSPLPVPTIAGVATVCLASLAAHRASISTHGYVQHGIIPSSLSFGGPSPLQQQRHSGIGGGRSFVRGSYEEDFIDLKYVQVPFHTLRMYVSQSFILGVCFLRASFLIAVSRNTHPFTSSLLHTGVT